MDKFEVILDKFLGPIANKMNQSKFFSALAEAFMRATPITLGVSFLMIIGNFPIQPWIDWLAKVGLNVHFNAAVGATLNALSIYIVFNFAYTYVKHRGENGLTPGLLGIASFLLLAPQYVAVPALEQTVAEFPAQATVTGMNYVESFQTAQTGGPGLIVAILVGYVTAILYLFLKRKNLVIKLPASVPPNVSESLAPTFISGGILFFFLVVRIVFAYTPFDNIFNLLYTLLQAPLEALTASPISIILVYSLANLFWFFGIHPNVVYGVVTPMLMANFNANTNAFINGESVPFLMMAVVYTFTSNAYGGQGATYGLIFSMARAKSARYKELFKLAFAPSLFNINEPLVFGMPIMLNPIFFIPMVIGPMLQGGLAWGMANLLDVVSYNAALQLPWTMPSPISAALVGGWKWIIIAIVVLIVNFIMWFPFFKIADRRAVEEEQAMEQAA